MVPTDDLRNRLRRLLNDKKPLSGSLDNLSFEDADLDELLEEASSVFDAAASGWVMKAGYLTQQIEGYSLGQEKYDLVSLKDNLNHALAMADRYRAMAISKEGRSGILLNVKRPEVMQ